MTPEQRILQLENQVATLQKDLKDFRDLFDSLFKGSSPTKLYFKNQITYDKESRVGFFGKDPAKQQSAPTPTVAEIKTALQNLGLLQ